MLVNESKSKLDATAPLKTYLQTPPNTNLQNSMLVNEAKSKVAATAPLKTDVQTPRNINLPTSMLVNVSKSKVDATAPLNMCKYILVSINNYILLILHHNLALKSYEDFGNILPG